MGLTAVGVASAVGGVASAVIGSNASRRAANTQAQATDRATDAQLQALDTLRGDLAPFVEAGQGGMNQLTALTNAGVFSNRGPGFTPLPAFQPITADNLEQTPGYQFTRDQGIRAVTNNMSAQGLVGSGAQAKGIAEYVTGLAQNTYNQQVQNNIANFMTGNNANLANFTTGFNANQTELNNIYNRLLGITQLGQNSAALQANATMGTGQQIGQNTIAGGNAAASGIMGGANAISGGLNTALSGAANAYMTNQLLARYGGAPTGSPTAPRAS